METPLGTWEDGECQLVQVADIGEAWLPETGHRGGPGSRSVSRCRLLPPAGHRLHQRPHPGESGARDSWPSLAG